MIRFAPTLDPLTGLPRAWTSGLGGAPGFNLLNRRPPKLSNAFGAGGYFALNPTDTTPTATDSGTDSSGFSGPPTINIASGFQPHDYAFDINSDPAYAQLKSLLSAQGISDASHLRGAVQQALIQFGYEPSAIGAFVDPSTGTIDEQTASLAANNPFSVLKHLQQSYQDQQDAEKNQLAARGILNSGETGYQLGRLGQAQARSQYDATNGLLSGIGTLNDAYVKGQQAAAQQLAQGAFAAEGNAVANGAGPAQAETVTATYNPTTGTWVDPNGRHYSQDGAEIALPPPPPPVNSGGTTYGAPAFAPTAYDQGNRAAIVRGTTYAS